jgi:hypothetical protein
VKIAGKKNVIASKAATKPKGGGAPSSKVASAPPKTAPKVGAPPKAAASKAVVVKSAPGTISGAIVTKVAAAGLPGAHGAVKAAPLKIKSGQKDPPVRSRHWHKLRNRPRVLRLCPLLTPQLAKLQLLHLLRTDQMMIELRFVRCMEWRLNRCLPPIRRANHRPQILSQLRRCQFPIW